MGSRRYFEPHKKPFNSRESHVNSSSELKLCNNSFREEDDQITNSVKIGNPRKRFKKRANYEHSDSEMTSRFSKIGKESKTKKDVEVYNEQTDHYFKQALDTLRQGIEDEQKELFVSNVLDQTKDQELQLSSQAISSHSIEYLLNASEDISPMIRFMVAFEKDRAQCCGNRYASHITENLLYYGVCYMKNWTVAIEASEGSKESIRKAEQVVAVITWIHGMGEFCVETLKTCLEDQYACHVLRTLIQVLGGCYIGGDANQSKRSRAQKRHFEQEYLSDDLVLKKKEALTLNEVPKSFIKTLKKLSKAFLKLDDLKLYAAEGMTATVIESFLFVLRKRLPKYSKKFVNAITNILFGDVDNEGVPSALLHRNCSYVVEKVFESATDDWHDLWNNFIAKHLEKLVGHPIGNFVIQRLFDIVEDGSQFGEMCEAMSHLYSNILESQRYGVFVSITAAAAKLKAQQGQITKDLMKCLHCFEPEERQSYFVPGLLGFQMYDNHAQQKSFASNPAISVTLQGSLVTQSLLKFRKPIKVVRSILSMKPQELKYLACHTQGCYVLTCFFGSDSVGEKNKDRFLDLLKPVLASTACDRNGSLTLSRIWVLLSLKQKSLIAQELLQNEGVLVGDRNGKSLFGKFGLYHYKRKYEQWKQFQNSLSERKQTNDSSIK